MSQATGKSPGAPVGQSGPDKDIKSRRVGLLTETTDNLDKSPTIAFGRSVVRSAQYPFETKVFRTIVPSFGGVRAGRTVVR